MGQRKNDKGNTKKIIVSKECTGCMACKYVCPVSAITITQEEDTFYYPKIDENKCVLCGKCKAICPICTFYEKLSNDVCYAVQAEDNIRNDSSSGGMFSLIAEYFIKSGGFVIGAAYNDQTVKHICVNSIEDLHKLRKSKYVQSNCDEVYKKIQDTLKTDKLVLFTGTPCQCAAVKNLFGSNDNLFLLDILCMGVPSEYLLKKYLSEDLQGIRVKEIDFRDKEKRGWTSKLVLKITGENSVSYFDSEESSYYKSFLDAYSIRSSCTKCVFPGKKRIGDISLGDFWGIEALDSSFDDRKGTSLVLINSEKGKQLIKLVESRIKRKREYPIKQAFFSNPILLYPTLVSSKQREFTRDIKKCSINENYTRLKSNIADCGIINYWWCNDNGAILTAFALQKLLEKNGYTSRLINICEGNQLEVRSGGISSQFEKRYLYTTEQVVTQGQFKLLNNSFKHFIVGSDQVFRAAWVSNRWYLDFVNLEKNKIAMAASFGVQQLDIPYKRKKEIQYLLHRFNNISIRELSGVSLCNSIGINADYVIDPVFLIDKEYYIELFSDVELDKETEPYIFVYLRDPSDTKNDAIDKYAKMHDVSVRFADDETNVEMFMKMIYNAKYVITDSYHGFCFALIFNKNFACFRNTLRGNDRFETIATILKTTEEKFANEGSEDVTKQLDAFIDWRKVNHEISIQREAGEKWLINALRTPSKINIKKVCQAYIPVLALRMRDRIMFKVVHNRLTHILSRAIKLIKKNDENE